MKISTLLSVTLWLYAAQAAAQVPPALLHENLGLYGKQQFRLADGHCQDCALMPQAAWYFQTEPIAVPVSVAPASLPPLIWLGSSQVLEDVRLSADHRSIETRDGTQHAFNVVPKLATNRSYLDERSWRFFANRPLKMRGEPDAQGGFVARTLWPQDYRLLSAVRQPLQTSEDLKQLVQAENGGAQSAFSSRLLWARSPGQQNWQGKAVFGLMLNGAQGDDDEAHGGHFGIVTGRYSADGDWSNWLVNNIYNLDAYSEKAIVAAPTPMDKYLMDLNSGQSWYRPSYMLVAVMRDEAIPARYQSAINRVYHHFYRHDIVYDHSQANCSGISLDTFKRLGWQVPERGSEGELKAIAAWFYVAATSGSLQDARKLYDYLTTETTRLYPAVAFDAMGNDLLALAQGKASRTLNAFEQDMAGDIEAIFFVRIPQVPSTRAFGLAPVYSFDQYLSQAPADRSQWQIVPTEPRPFPDSLRDGQAHKDSRHFPIPWPVMLVLAGLLGTLAILVRWLWRRRKNRWSLQIS